MKKPLKKPARKPRGKATLKAAPSPVCDTQIIPKTPARSGSLIAAGVIDILIGSAFFLMAVFVMMVRWFVPSGAAVPRQSQNGFLIFLGMAGIFFLLGWGLVQKRRWALALAKAASWYCLVLGIYVAVFFLVRGNVLTEGLSGLGGIDADTMRKMWRALSVVVGGGLILLPGLHLALLSGEAVRRTSELRDPKGSWTDQQPLPLLILFVMFAGGALVRLFGIDDVYPLFGLVVEGWPAILLTTGHFILDAAILPGILRRKMLAWRLMLVAILFNVSNLLTLVGPNGRTYLEKTGMTASGSAIYQAMSKELLPYGVCLLAMAAFILYCRRYFLETSTGGAHLPAVSPLKASRSRLSRLNVESSRANTLFDSRFFVGCLGGALLAFSMAVAGVWFLVRTGRAQ